MEVDEKELEMFLRESNAIESEYSEQAFEDSWRAWKFIINFDELTFSRLLEVHRVIMNKLNNRIAGRLRSCNVRVSDRKCPDYTLVSGLLNEWFVKYSKANTEGEIKKAHIEFEKIHPFEDGNGRSGRIIMNWQRLLNDLPLLIIHEGEEQKEYYTWF